MKPTRYLLITMVMALVTMSSTASDNDAGSLNERFYQAKLREMV